LNKLWAPWRMEYLVGTRPEGCVFCKTSSEDSDRDNLILYRGAEAFVIINRYPYTNGHLMVVPYIHKSDLADMSNSTLLEIFDLLKRCQEILRQSVCPQGFNVGLNLGKAGGAGIHEHLHFHIVPRWDGDTNFMPILGDCRVISEHLLDTYDRLFPFFNKLANHDEK
jgi:ATP adenylyltransferase